MQQHLYTFVPVQCFLAVPVFYLQPQYGTEDTGSEVSSGADSTATATAATSAREQSPMADKRAQPGDQQLHRSQVRAADAASPRARRRFFKPRFAEPQGPLFDCRQLCQDNPYFSPAFSEDLPAESEEQPPNSSRSSPSAHRSYRTMGKKAPARARGKQAAYFAACPADFASHFPGFRGGVRRARTVGTQTEQAPPHCRGERSPAARGRHGGGGGGGAAAAAKEEAVANSTEGTSTDTAAGTIATSSWQPQLLAQPEGATCPHPHRQPAEQQLPECRTEESLAEHAVTAAVIPLSEPGVVEVSLAQPRATAAQEEAQKQVEQPFSVNTFFPRAVQSQISHEPDSEQEDLLPPSLVLPSGSTHYEIASNASPAPSEFEAHEAHDEEQYQHNILDLSTQLANLKAMANSGTSERDVIASVAAIQDSLQQLIDDGCIISKP